MSDRGSKVFEVIKEKELRVRRSWQRQEESSSLDKAWGRKGEGRNW